jgi:hypothetical protein
MLVALPGNNAQRRDGSGNARTNLNARSNPAGYSRVLAGDTDLGFSPYAARHDDDLYFYP